jgi:hypothetical protein
MQQEIYRDFCYNCGTDTCLGSLYPVCPECFDLIQLGREYQELLRANKKEETNGSKTTD